MIPRSDIKGAPYNPRQISSAALRRLRDNIRKRGLLGTIVVNRQTMQVVSGHQRLAALDALERNDSYGVGVTLTDLNDEDEKSQNVFMNNPQAQGDWDMALLDDVLRDVSDLGEAGFDRLSLEILFGDDRFGGLFSENSAPETARKTAHEAERIVMDSRERHKEFQRIRKEYREKDTEAVETEFYAVVVFDSPEEKEAWLKHIGAAEDDRYVGGELVALACGLDLSEYREGDEPEAEATEAGDGAAETADVAE